MAGAVQVSSRFDPDLENDYEGADQTLNVFYDILYYLQFDTVNLKEVTESYNDLIMIDNEQDKMIVK